MREMNPLVWFGTRLVNPIPKHFVRASTPITSESEQWVLTKLKGRYGTGTVDITSSNMVISAEWNTFMFFEDPAEATFYELRWAGK